MKKNMWVMIILAIIVVILVGVFLKTKEKVSNDSIRIGVLESLSGPATYYGERTKNGIIVGQYWLKTNYPNTKFEIFHEDNKFDPRVGITAYNSLRERYGIDAVIAQTSPVAVAVKPLALKDGVPIVAISASANAYVSPDDLSFRTTAGTNLEVKPMVKYIEKRFKKVAVLYMNNEIGASINNSLSEVLASSTLSKISYSQAYATDASDFRTTLLKMKETKPDALYVAGLAMQTATILKQLKELSISIPVLTFRTGEDQTLIKNAGALAEGVVFTSAFDPQSTDPEVVSFVNTYREKFGIVPDVYGAEAYEGIRLLGMAFNKCGKDDNCIKSNINNLSNYHSIFGVIDINNDGDMMYEFFLKTVKAGQFVRLENQ